MRKTKAKNNSFWQARTLVFAALWAGIYGAAWGALMVLLQISYTIGSIPLQETTLVSASIVGLMTAMSQSRAVDYVLNKSMRGWTLYSMIGLVLSFATYLLFFRVVMASPRLVNLFSGFTLPFLFTSLLVPLPLVQYLWLRRRVRSAWVWPLISLVTAWIVGLMLPTYMMLRGSGNDFLLIATLVHALIQGVAMRYLWTQDKNTEKAKVDFDIDEDTSHDEERAARLQHADSPPVTWHSRDEHAIHRQDQ